METYMETYRAKKYTTDVECLRETLDLYGVAVIPSVLDEAECEAMKEGMWNYLEHVTANLETPITRDAEASWKGIHQLYPLHSMLLQWWGIGHAQFIWDIRANPKVVDIWSRLWDTPAEDLLVSFDGASFHMPPETTGRGWFRGTQWLHRDQSYTRPNFECVQSWVTAYDVNRGDATLTFLEGSHKHTEEFAARFAKTSKDDWCKLESLEEQAFYVDEKGCKQRSIACPAGSMVFWDSRTIHSGREALKDRAEPNTRCVVYLCYQPRALATPALLRKKQEAFTQLRTTSHYPAKPKLFPKAPRTYGSPVPEVRTIPTPIVSRLGMKLAGF
jgi:ectoine hydroxylase-related dioxygenase (phytanoyl-CoA dioxygenase family)